MARKHLGERDYFACRPPKAVGDRIRQEAGKDMTYNDLITKIVADHYGLPATNDETKAQQELPMTA